MKKTDVISHVREQLLHLFEDGSAVVLVGSAARDKNDENSDIDLLIINNTTHIKSPAILGFHVQHTTEAEFLANLAKGEDFEAWAVRFGIPIRSNPSWERIAHAESPGVWPNWRTKIQHAARRLFIGDALLNMGDLDASREELLYSLGHISRGLLLKSNIFPLSRPELSEQVHEIGYPHLASLHEHLRVSDDVSLGQLRSARRYAKKLLIFLDRGIFLASSNAHRLNSRAKSKSG